MNAAPDMPTSHRNRLGNPRVGGVCSLGETGRDCEELARLADEEAVVGECSECSHGGTLCLRRPDDRADGNLRLRKLVGSGRRPADLRQRARRARHSVGCFANRQPLTPDLQDKRDRECPRVYAVTAPRMGGQQRRCEAGVLQGFRHLGILRFSVSDGREVAPRSHVLQKRRAAVAGSPAIALGGAVRLAA